MLTAAERIKQFLAEHPKGKLTVAIGFASINGLAWLHRQTLGRPVDLLIGDTRANQFKEGQPEKRREAIEFLNRRDIEVYNWFSNHPKRREAHLKVWHISQPNAKPAVLVGSANLTDAGLFHNYEAMCEAGKADTERIRSQLNELFGKAWVSNKEGLTVRKRLLEYIGSPQTQVGVPSESMRRGGCLQSALLKTLGICAILGVVATAAYLIGNWPF